MLVKTARRAPLCVLVGHLDFRDVRNFDYLDATNGQGTTVHSPFRLVYSFIFPFPDKIVLYALCSSCDIQGDPFKSNTLLEHSMTSNVSNSNEIRKNLLLIQLYSFSKKLINSIDLKRSPVV